MTGKDGSQIKLSGVKGTPIKTDAGKTDIADISEGDEVTPVSYTHLEYGISLIHFGVVMVVVLCIGLVTPPVGLNLFVASSVGGQPVHKIIPHLPVLIGAILVGAVIIVFVPALSTFLPSLL